MKRTLLFLLAMTIGLFALYGTAHAESWICSNCGAENSGFYCGNCGTKKPSAEWTCPDCGNVNSTNFCSYCGRAKPAGGGSAKGSTISGITFKRNKNGSINISWKDSADKGPYEIYYTTDDWESFTTKYGEDSYSKKSATCDWLIPGVTYKITITNGTSSTTTEYTVPKDTFTDFTTGKELVMKPDSFNVSGEDYYKTFRLTVRYPRLSRSREYTYLLALKTPRGYSSCVYRFETYELDRQYKGMYVDYGLDTFLDIVKQNFGEVMRGEYTFEVYFDGALYASVPFHVYP